MSSKVLHLTETYLEFSAHLKPPSDRMTIGLQCLGCRSLANHQFILRLPHPVIGDRSKHVAVFNSLSLTSVYSSQ